jgi:hypothetical protein
VLYLLACLGYAVLALRVFAGLLVDPLGDFGLFVSADAQCCREHDCSITSLGCHVAQSIVPCSRVHRMNVCWDEAACTCVSKVLIMMPFHVKETWEMTLRKAPPAAPTACCDEPQATCALRSLEPCILSLDRKQEGPPRKNVRARHSVYRTSTSKHYARIYYYSRI